MSNKTSLSSDWRLKGNKEFEKVIEGKAPCLAQHNLKEALNYYYKAENYAERDEEKASAKKNIAISASKLARLLLTTQADNKLIDFYFKEALTKFYEANQFGGHKGAEWSLGIQTMSLQTWLNIQDRLDSLDTEVKIRRIEPYIQYLLDDDTKASAFSTLAEWVLHLAVLNVTDRNFQVALSYLKDCYFPVCEGIKYAKSESMKKAFETIQDDIFISSCIAESLQALETADNLLTSVVCDEEELNIDILWDIIDWFRRVIYLTREKDIELEAMAHSRIGHVYEKILKMDSRARQYYNKCIELANTLRPRFVYEKDWYRLAADGLDRYRKADRKQEEEELEEENKEIKEKLKEKLVELGLKFKSLSKMEFLKFLYKTYPPKNTKHKLGKTPDKPEPSDLKKLYQRGVTHYHPDKVNVDSHGREWKLLCSEITKLLTSHYEYFKNCSA